MKIKQTLSMLTFIILAGSTAGIASGIISSTAGATDCGGVQTSIIGNDICKTVDNKSSDPHNNAIWVLLILVLNIMTAGVGILAVGGIVYGSILYASAGDKAEQTKKAISIITNVVIGIIAFGLMYLILNFIIPGGIFN
jgi:hypothetical protein